MNSPIASLAPEILLQIFEVVAQDPHATLVSSILCCKKWSTLALPVLYSDVFLSPNRLFKFLNNCADQQIRSLTLRMDAISVGFGLAEAAQTAKRRLEALERLSQRIKKMGLVSLSFNADLPIPFTATREISSILDNLPSSCSSLEIDIRQNGSIMTCELLDEQRAHPQTAHVCNSIRTILPQLVYFRLRLPEICSALFGVEVCRENTLQYEAVSAPKLKVCIINLSLREPGPGSSSACATKCEHNIKRIVHIVGLATEFTSALPPLLRRLHDFAQLNSASLQRLVVIDVHERDIACPHSWEAWVRRDFLSGTSAPIPFANIGGFKKNARLARVPAEEGEAEDWLSSTKLLEAVAEGSAWSETVTGVRLATPMLRGCERLSQALTKSQFLQENNISCMLWKHEEMTGEKLLPEGPGPLMQKWNIEERTPSGWKRPYMTG